MSIYKSFAEEQNAVQLVLEDFFSMRGQVTELVETNGQHHPATVNAVARMEVKAEWLRDEIRTAAMRAAGGVL